MGVHRAGAGRFAVAPHLQQKLLAAEHGGAPAGEAPQQVELGGGEVDRRPRKQRPPGGGLELHVADALRLDAGVGCRAFLTAQDGPDAGHQLPGAERLGEIVVGPHGQADEHVGFVVAGGEHENGNRGLVLDPPADLQAVESRQHQVEHHQVG